MSNTYKTGETAIIECEIDGIDSAVSGVNIEIQDFNNNVAVSGTSMSDLGNQQYRFYWNTASGYSAFSGYTGYSSYSGGVTSGYSGISGYSCIIDGIYTLNITVTDVKGHIGFEKTQVRVRNI